MTETGVWTPVSAAFLVQNTWPPLVTLGLQPHPQKVVRPPKPTPTTFSGGGWSPRVISSTIGERHAAPECGKSEPWQDKDDVGCPDSWLKCPKRAWTSVVALNSACRNNCTGQPWATWKHYIDDAPLMACPLFHSKPSGFSGQETIFQTLWDV